MSEHNHVCRWILIPAFMEGGPQYCERPVKYHMQPDGGEPGAAKVRTYDAFCPEHQAKFTSQKDIDDDDDF
jgi:hypothetical protein